MLDAPQNLAKLAKAAILDGMPAYTIGEAKTQLSKLVRRAEAGEEVVLRRGSTPVARLVAITASERSASVRRSPGSMRGRIHLADDFDSWPVDVARSLGLED